MDGWQTLEALRQACVAQGAALPRFVMVSANGRASLDLRTKEEQALINDFVVKPVTAAMLGSAATERPAADARVRRAPRSNQRALAGVRILVVDDNAINQQVAEELLSSQGAEVSIASDGEVAVNAIAAARTPYDVVLMDIQMPVMDGFEATRVIRQNLGLPDLPIVGLTANAMASDREDCLRAGMNEHIGKPFDLAQLVSVVIRLTGQRSPGQYPATAATAATDVTASTGSIDVAGALARMGGMEKLYMRSARDLLLALPNGVPTLAAALQAGDGKRCAMLLHTLKGNAGTLGLNPLANLLAGMEALCQQQDGLADCAEQLDALGHSIGVAQQALQDALRTLGAQAQMAAEADADADTEGHRDAGAGPSAVPGAALQAAIARLLPLLVAEDFDALDVFAAERAVLEGLPEHVLAGLEAAMQDLDWLAAWQILQQPAALPG
jgi:CheY-like chemotaxis protein